MTVKLTICNRCGVEKRPKDFLGDRTRCKSCSMSTLTVDSIKDFQVCSLFYDYRYNQELYEPKNNRVVMANNFNETLTRVISFLLYKKQSGVTPSYNAIVNRWQRLWFPKDMDAYDLAVERHTVSHGNLTQYSTKAVVGLKQLYDDFDSDKIEPILINEHYSVPITPEIILEGIIDLIYRVGDRYHVVMWSTKQKKPNPNSLQMEISGLKLAVENRSIPQDNITYHMYDVGSDKPGFITIEDELLDSSLVTYWGRQTVEGEYVPRRGYTAYCKGCPFDEQCKEFSFKKELNK